MEQKIEISLAAIEAVVNLKSTIEGELAGDLLLDYYKTVDKRFIELLDEYAKSICNDIIEGS